ncbi:hypothetical protein [Bdellovibrio sp. HCB2-146]|uniref:hypothetical protein n=1 Tax=Bdellovibrio sp. HCB2-146 TaxID=3394362 RepID=UPI0039BD7394
MRIKVFVHFAWVAILCHFSVAQAIPMTCESLFKGPAGVSASIEEPLVALRDLLSQFQKSLLEPRESEDILSPLKDLPEDPREIAFVLQGSYRLLLSHPHVNDILSEKQIRKLQAGMDQMKWFEKKLGEYGNSKDLVKAAKKIEVPLDFLEHLKAQRNSLAQTIHDKLLKRGYIDAEISAVTGLIEELRGMRKLDSKMSDTYLPESLQAEILRVKEKVDSEMKGLIMKPTYTFHEVEEGAHAFRRSLRWLKVYILAYRDHFSLIEQKNPATAYESHLRELYASDLSIALSVDGKIKLREMDYYLLNDLIAELRKIKGIGEIKEQMTRELISFGKWNGRVVSAEKATDIVAARLDEKLVDLEIRTQEILGNYENAFGLRRMIVGGL